MRSIINTFIFVLAGLLSAQAYAQDTSEEIQTMLENRDQQIKELLGPKGSEYTEEQTEELKGIINGVIDFDAMAKIALEDTYNTISDEQRTEFVDLFSTIIRDNSLKKLDIYRAKVTYTNIDVDGNLVLVETTAELDDVRTPVNYKMRKEGEEWVITDMSIDDVYTAESYNRQFQRIINRRGFDSLMESLRKRAATS